MDMSLCKTHESSCFDNWLVALLLSKAIVLIESIDDAIEEALIIHKMEITMLDWEPFHFWSCLEL